VHHRAKLMHYEELAPALPLGKIPCRQCGREAKIVPTMPAFVPVPEGHLGLHILCEHCGVMDYTSLSGVGGSSPQMIRFNKANPRTHVLPPQPLNYQGREAVRLSVQSFHQNDVLDFIFAADTYEILAIYRNGELDEV
jgi:hypothetical protein